MSLKLFKKDLHKLADPAKAKILQRFFKTGKGQYGEGDRFLGIIMPQQRSLVKKYWEQLSLQEIEALLKSQFHEERLCALLCLVEKFDCTVDEKVQKKIYNFYLEHAKHINNWDLVDLSAPKIVGEYLQNKNRQILYKLAKSKNLWERRIGILSTFAFIKKGEDKDALAIAKILLNDKHDLIHKATGWMLREAGKRCKEKTLTGFLDKHVKQMPRTMLRYAIERLPEKKRKYYLNV